MHRKLFLSLLAFFVVLFIISYAYAEESCSLLPPGSGPGGDHADDTYAVDSGFIREGAPPLNSDPHAVIFENGYYNELSSLFNALKKSETRTDTASSALELLDSTPLLIIPSGGLYGMENSTFLKASLDEYVKRGGTLIVLGQQHGYEFSILPTPDGKPLSAYGWTEDQSCFWNGTYVDTYHQIMSGITTPTVSAGVDGYFTSYPENSTILLRRTVNGQPAMLMYEHGLGRVIVTSFFSDWGYAHSQTTNDEIAIIRDMISWAKKPAQLPEIKQGQSVSVQVTVTNSTAANASSVKLQIYNPDRTAFLAEQNLGLSIASGQSATTTVNYQTAATASTGIYHIDYILLDAGGNILQPQAETDTGRFVVSNPPSQTISKTLTFKVNAPAERFPYGSEATFTWHVWNNSNAERTVTIRYGFPHHTWETGDSSYGNFQNLSKTLTVPANGEATFSHTIVVKTEDQLFSWLYDENNAQIGESRFKIWRFFPSVNATVKTDKATYARGDTVNLGITVQNKQNYDYTTNLKIAVLDPANLAVYNNSLNMTIPANGTSTQELSFAIPSIGQAGFYTVILEAYDSTGNKAGGNSATFEVPLHLVRVLSNLPSVLNIGNNTVPFTLTNDGKMNVSAGKLDIQLKDPDGTVVFNSSNDFTLAVGESKTIDVPVNIPPLKFGNYSFIFTQSDETKQNKPVIITLTNSAAVETALDKASYRIRETASLSVVLTNTGKFNLDNVSVTVSAPDASYNNTSTVNLPIGQNIAIAQSIPLPDTLTVGEHPVNVSLALPGGSVLSKSVNFIVPQSSLALSLNNANCTAGGTVNPVIANSGGVDTQVLYTARLYDAKSVMIAEKSNTENVQAGGILALNFLIPAGAMEGVYNLVVNYKDLKTIKTENAQKTLIISGVKAGLSVQTDRRILLLKALTD